MNEQNSRRWLALVVISLAQLMVALDVTVINIALPSVQRALHVSGPERQWVITAYTLTFGGLLILGGRLCDAFGRRRVFLTALAGFAAASSAGGAAPNFGTLLAARAAQGAFAALLAPAALSLLALSFTNSRDRAKAFAIFGAIVIAGGTVGLLVGGALTEYAEWRWCLFVNVPVAIAAFAGGQAVLPRMPGQGRSRLDMPGAVLVTAGLVAVVYAFSQAASKGWSSASVVGFLTGGMVLLAAFIGVEFRTPEPLLPINIVLNRNRGGCYLILALTVAGQFGMFLFLTYYFQVVQHYAPARAGVAFLPMPIAAVFSSMVMARALLPRVAPRLLIVPGLLIAAAGMATLTRLHVHAGYASYVLPGELLLGLGLGCVFVPAISTATSGVGPREAGIVSAAANAAQQIGASLGTALLNTIATSATAAYLAGHGRLGNAAGLVHGYATASAWATGILVAAGVAAGLLINAGAPARVAGSPARAASAAG